MIGEELLLQSTCSEESFGHFSGCTEEANQLSVEDFLMFSPELQQTPVQEIVETHETPGTVLQVRDLGKHKTEPGSWKLKQYHRIELTLDRNSLPIIVHNESWCKGNCKTSLPEINEPHLILSVYAIAEEEIVKPCRQPKCPSTSARAVVQVTSSSQLLDARNDDTDGNRSAEINVRIMCIPFHHRNLMSFSLRFVIEDNDGNLVCSTMLDIGRAKANRSNSRATKNNPGFHNPPLGFVLVLIKTTHLTFRTNWRAVQH